MARKTPTSTEPPIPRTAIRKLEKLLGRSYKGWEKCPPRFASPVPDVEGCYFDAEAVAKVIRVLRKLPHTKDRWAGSPFDPEPWQVVWLIAPVFGWKRPDGRRLVRKVWLEIPRKNGKSSLASRLAVVLLGADGAMGGEVYACATSENQARQVFDEARVVVRKSSVFRSRTEVLASLIRYPSTGGIFRVLSKMADVAHGLNPSGAVIDEVHLHKKSDLISAIETGRGARSQPLLIYITTAGDDDNTTIYAKRHAYAEQIGRRDRTDPAWWVAIWSAEATADPLSPKTWAQANPNYPISPTPEFLEEEFRQAVDTPSDMRAAKRFYLNIRGDRAEEAWEGAEAWSLGSQLVVLDKLKATPVWVGLVCASATDLSAIALVHRNPEGVGWWAHWYWFLPRDSLTSLDRRTEGAAGAWAKDRLEITEGNVIDVARHTAVIREIAKTYDLRELVYDPNGSVGVISPLVEDYEDLLTPIYSTNPASALLDWERLLKAGEFNHGGDPIAAWQLHHLRVKESMTKVIKIDRKASTDNVFGLAAVELALRRALVAQEPFVGTGEIKWI